MGVQDGVRGMGVPFRIGADGGVGVVAGPEKVRQNVRVVLGTRQGERPLERDFGTRLRSLVHDPNDHALATLAERQVREALLRWEPRLLVTSSRIVRHEGELSLHLEYVHTDEPVASEAVIPIA